MATNVKRPKRIAQQMLERKRQIEDYFKSGDESKNQPELSSLSPLPYPLRSVEAGFVFEKDLESPTTYDLLTTQRLLTRKTHALSRQL